MSNWIRLGISALISLVLTVTAYFLIPYNFIPSLYYFAPGFYLSEVMPESLTRALGGDLFPVIISGVIWALLIFGVWLLLVRLKRRNYR